nr:thiosulfate sulfurtransferase/rhodanese-like domain-containing protein 3 [Pogona vitticeps]
MRFHECSKAEEEAPATQTPNEATAHEGQAQGKAPKRGETLKTAAHRKPSRQLTGPTVGRGAQPALGGGTHVKERRVLETAKPTACHFCTADNSKVSYKELKGLLESKSVFLIDVREKWEIAEYGQIPGSISIPLGEIVEALQMNPQHFKERYSHDMPSKADCLVFSCLAGVRSNQALISAKTLGFSRAQHYAGGFKGWTEYESSEKK